MPETAQYPVPEDADDLEYDVEAAIAACDGDARAAVRSLLVVNSTQEHRIASLEQRIARLVAVASVGYIRGKLPEPPTK
jgi:hypothetical protein